MKIKCTRAGMKALGHHGHSAQFDKDGFATVEKEVGDALAAAYPEIIEVVKEKKTTRKSPTTED